MAVANEGTWDRVIRLLAAIAFGLASWLTWPGAAATVLLVLATIAAVTGLVGWCVLYALFGVSTKKKAAA
jgi:hypothetical protein